MSIAPPQVSSKLFGLFCLASYLLSLSYGATFLLSLLIGSRGGNEHDAGSVISTAMLSTFAAVIVSGHLSDLLGAARSIALFGVLLVAASLGFALTLYLVELGQGNVFLLLLISGALCILLGMGMPTLGVYVLLAVLFVPAFVEVGVSPMAAHMFILYLGMMSFVTPPVAIAFIRADWAACASVLVRVAGG